MSIKRLGETKKKEGSITILAAGEYEGRLRYVADLGLHKNDYNGEPKPDVQKLALGIEILGETVEIDGVSTPRLMWAKPFNIFHSMTEKGNELKLFKVFNPSAVEGSVADWDSVLNEPCNVVIAHTQGKGDKSEQTYDNVYSIASIPSKYKSGITEGSITDSATGDVDDDSNPAQAACRGLPSWFIENRIQVGNDLELEEMVDDEVLPF